MEPLIEISSTLGLTARFLPLGATLTSLLVQDRDGKPVDVVLGFDNYKDYLNDTMYMGRTVGRVCNRIRHGRFTFDNKQFELPINSPPHHLHSGPSGIALKDWNVVQQTPTSVSFRMCVSESEDGFPGDAKIDVTYTVNDRNQLLIEHGAHCTKAGVLSLTNHSYWNLDGSQSVKNHFLKVGADAYLPTDQGDLPTGEIRPVEGTRFDFTQEKSLECLLDKNGNIDIDNDLILRPARNPHRALSLFSPISGIKMVVTTSYPVIHLYGGRHINCKGKNGESYGSGKGISIEPQFHTAAVNYDNFPDIRLSPDRPYFQEIVYSFSVSPNGGH
ncbi:hypothetical protein KIN20_016254 [Parelaphostrongylus tenuis]|uniref:Aldose 1-epimerase n=1 Tax=Parelaphostrongylus tenuis TaxID=148309 RepID=A0AAD5QT30_PARTN|nr:hypothetical protein KIN20_016254 [Parelaphostrongylus tenuis]